MYRGSKGLVERRNSLRKMVVNKWYCPREKKLQPIYLKSPNIFCSFFTVSLCCVSRGSGLPQVKVSPLVLRGIMCTCESLALPDWFGQPIPGEFYHRVSQAVSPLPGRWEREKVIEETNCKGNLRSTVFFMAKEGFWTSRTHGLEMGLGWP